MDYKTPDEIIDVSFDYTANLGDVETISAATVTVFIRTGVDANPSAMLSGLPSVSDGVVYHRILGGTAGNVYSIQCLADTSVGRRLELVGILPVISLV